MLLLFSICLKFLLIALYFFVYLRIVSGSEVSVKVKKGSMGRVAVAAGGMEGISASTGVSADEDRVKESGGDSVSLSDRFQSIVAFSSYSVLSGEGEGVLGDGKI